jgi:predicted phosphate transport protein (TIGR00153 family)
MALFDFFKNDDQNYFQLFEDAANNMLEAARVFRELCYNYQDATHAAELIHEFEHTGDAIGHRMYGLLNRTFMTPLDREDIINLYSAIDDVTDLVHSAADMMAIYKVEHITPVAQQLADCIVACAEEVTRALPHLRKRNELKDMHESIIQIHSLENKADDLHRQGLVELFSDPTDVINIIKWRDIYQEMEQATDRAEDIADVLRGLAIKHA